MVRMPSFPNIPKERRLEILRGLGEKAREEFATHVPTVSRWFSEYDSLYILSFCAVYFCSHPEGIAPEVHGKLDCPHHYLEILQALALAQPRNIDARPFGGDAQRLKEDMQKVGELMQTRLLALLEQLTRDEEVHRHFLPAEMMLSTMAIRNWASVHQIRRIAIELLGLVRAEFEAQCGLNPERLVTVLLGLGQLAEKRLHEHIRRLRTFIGRTDYRELITAYGAAFPDTVPISPEQADVL